MVTALSRSLILGIIIYVLIVSVFFTEFSCPNMDFRARDTTWRAQLNDALQDSSGGDTGGCSGDMQAAMLKFRDLLSKRTRIWWNHEFLDKYIQNNLIPRGLRIQVFPSFPIQDDDFKAKWEELANVCSMGFLDLLKTQNKKTLTLLESEIEIIQLDLQKGLTGESLKKFNDELDVDLQKWAQETQATKTKKLKRDIQDKLTAHVYRWRHPPDRSRQLYRSMSRSRSRSTSIKSTVSVDDEASVQLSHPGGTLSSSSDPVTKRVVTRQSARKKTYTGRNFTDCSAGGLQVVNLSTHALTQPQLEVLSRGLTFSPTNPFNFFVALKDLHLFSRKLLLRKLHHKNISQESLTESEMEALRVLEDLLDEQTPPSRISLCFLCWLHVDSLVPLCGVDPSILDVRTHACVYYLLDLERISTFIIVSRHIDIMENADTPSCSGHSSITI
ncbi:uncharacterized protein [Dendrobates tinctorius]|uniref:uncharacterized protein isoform X2 n=1 Tax=Dendrobates tinctorius TaxID=92724 RepID=UPI003CCA32D4